MSAPHAGLRSLQVGMGWYPEQPGGLNRLFHELVRHLPAAGVAVQGLVVGSAAVARESGGAVHAFAPRDVPMWRRVAAARRAVERALRQPADAVRASAGPGGTPTVLVSHFAPYGVGMVAAARRLPLVVYFHGPWAAESSAQGRGPLSAWFRRLVERRVYGRAAACIVLSRAFGALLERDYGVPAARTHCIPGGVDCARFAGLPSRSDARRALGWPDDGPVVLAVRRLVKRTGVDRLVAAIPDLRARVPRLRVYVGGDGPERAALESQARSLGVQEVVRFLGHVPDERLPLSYRAADLSVVPTVALEGFGLIVPESLAAGTPVMVTPVGGLPETVEALDRALVLPDATAAAIAQGIGDALTGARPLPDMESCARFARAHFDWPIIARRVAELLARVEREWHP